MVTEQGDEPMTIHVHFCPHCDRRFPCSDACDLFSESLVIDGIYIKQGGHHPCSDCEQPIAEVDALPNPERGPLAGVALIRVVKRGVLAALRMAKQDPEAAPDELARNVDPMYPRDPTRTDADSWYRMGAVRGAKDAWSGALFRPPPDCPPNVAMDYVVGYNCAAAVVNQIRFEVGNHG